MSIKREDELLSRSDLDSIIDVNKKAIELQVEVSAQNEKVIEDLAENTKITENIKRDTESTLKELSFNKQDSKDYKNDILEKIDEIKDKVDKLDKNQFKIYVILTTGAIAIVLQIIQLFLNWKK